MTARVEAFAVQGVGEVTAGDDVAALVVAALRENGPAPRDGDIAVVSSKVVSKAQARAVRAGSRDEAVDRQTVRVVAERLTPRGVTRIVQSASGPVLAAAGVDSSNVAAGTVLLLPADPDASARALRSRLAELTGLRLGVLVTDTLGRPWREGQTDAAIGAAGVHVVDDLRGGTDGYGNPLEVTVRAVADEVAALADLVKGKLDGVPVALVRGLEHLVTRDDGPGAAALLRRPGEDWFRYGHVEAAHAALGVPPGRGLPAQPTAPGSLLDRVGRAVAVALAAPDPFAEHAAGPAAGPGERRPAVPVTVVVPPDGADPAAAHLTLGPASSEPALGALVQRVVVAAWAQDLAVTVDGAPADGVARLIVRPAPV